MSKFLFDREFFEHTSEFEFSGYPNIADQQILFRQRADCICLSISSTTTGKSMSAGYYVGCDWLIPQELAVIVSPKMDSDNFRIDHLRMMLKCLQHPEVLEHAESLFEIKFSSPSIEIDRRNDLLTPLMIIQFLIIVRNIVKKGLKRSYYRVIRNLNSKIKGKIRIAQTIKENQLKNRFLNAQCEFEEFGFNGIENRILKRTLQFIKDYLQDFRPYLKMDEDLSASISKLINYSLPAFDNVKDEVDLALMDQIPQSIFFKEYATGIRLAKLILRRHGKVIKPSEANDKICTPPFWIDMAKLFELYVLSILKDRYGKNVIYHFSARSNELDFLLNTEGEKIVIDAKYKPSYRAYNHNDDIRQLSGYARLQKVYDTLGIDPNGSDSIIDCLIVYPNQDSGEDLDSNLKKERIKSFVKMYKVGIKLPVISHE